MKYEDRIREDILYKKTRNYDILFAMVRGKYSGIAILENPLLATSPINNQNSCKTRVANKAIPL